MQEAGRLLVLVYEQSLTIELYLAWPPLLQSWHGVFLR